MSWATGDSPDGVGWPPPGEPVRGRGLPDDATLVRRAPLASIVAVVLSPLFLLVAYGRFLSLGLPASRVLNPGAFALTGLVLVALAGVCLRPGARVQVAGGQGWVARRTFPISRWRVVRLSSVREYSVRTYATRGPRVWALRMVDGDGRALTVSTYDGAGRAAWDALVAAVATQGAQRVEAAPFDGLPRRQVLGVVAIVLVVSLLPLPYLLVGPLRALPDGVAGWFSSSACRAALTAEDQQEGFAPAPRWPQTLQTGAATWHLVGQYTATVGQVADRTADPAARLTHLTSAGATGGYQLVYLGSDGSRIAVDAITFGSTEGATNYVHYVNRATCERWSGTSGPAPGEVRWRSGRTYGFARWAGGALVFDVSPVLASPEATHTEVDNLAAAAQATASR